MASNILLRVFPKKIEVVRGQEIRVWVMIENQTSRIIYVPIRRMRLFWNSIGVYRAELWLDTRRIWKGYSKRLWRGITNKEYVDIVLT